MPTTHKTFQLRGYLSKAGYQQLDEILAECAILYNPAIQEWRDAYKSAGVSVNVFHQNKEFTAVRAQDAFWAGISTLVGRGGTPAGGKRQASLLPPCQGGREARIPSFQVQASLADHPPGRCLQWHGEARILQHQGNAQNQVQGQRAITVRRAYQVHCHNQAGTAVGLVPQGEPRLASAGADTGERLQQGAVPQPQRLPSDNHRHRPSD